MNWIGQSVKVKIYRTHYILYSFPEYELVFYVENSQKTEKYTEFMICMFLFFFRYK